MLATDASPPAWRVAAAFVAAPTATAIILAWAVPLYGGMPDRVERVANTAVVYALVGAYPTTLLFGVPAFLVLRRRLPPTALGCSLVGAAVAALPWLLLGLHPAFDTGNSAIDGRATLIDGRTTLWGWFVWAQLVGTIAGMGAVGGAVFWLVGAARVSRRPLRRG